ncbi:MAG: 4Fe-4S dicluster domain-containing protein [Spirochaetia bacterium]
MVHMNRRDFLKTSAAAGSAAAVLAGCSSVKVGDAPAPQRMALLMDNSLCVNCQACRLACQNENNLPVEKAYIRFDYLEQGTFPNVESFLNRHSCHHCEDAPCIDVCPVNALYKGAGGFTYTDFETCIGCQLCQGACPFTVPTFGADPATGAWKMYKCNACKHLVAEGKTPACATTCLTNAVQYGTWDEMVAKAEARVEALKDKYPAANVYGTTQQDGLGLLLVLRSPPADYPHLV